MSALPHEHAIVAERPRLAEAPAARVDRGGAWTALLGLLVLPVLAHLAFSRFGFNPTDDGFVLASARRLLDGQVPHRDFVSIRPVGSSLLHAPELLVGGDAVFLLGRFATWLEIGFLAWGWVALARRWTGGPRGGAASALAVVVAFTFTASTFPLMPWHTIDALVLSTAGFLLVRSHRAAVALAGCALVGAATLCRQNFLPLGLVALALLPRPRRIAGALAWLAPPALYATALAALGALPDALLQLRGQTGLLEPGLLRYVRSLHVATGVALGAGLAIARRRAADRAALAPLAPLAVAMLLGWAAWTMGRKDEPFLGQASFVLFGAALGSWLAGLAYRDAPGETRFGGLALATAWCASISIGMNTPALAAGGLAVHLLLAIGREPSPPAKSGRAAMALALVTLLVVTALWADARRRRVYRDRPIAQLTAPLDGRLAGGRGLRTGPKTAELMADLQRAVALAGARPVAIVADFPAHWVRSPGPNPLSIDWPQGTELARPELRQRVIADLERLRGRGVILVQRHHTSIAWRVFLPTADTGDYFLVAHVRERFRRTGGTAHFDLYE